MTTEERLENEFDALANDTVGDSEKVFFPFGGDKHDFSAENCKKFIAENYISKEEVGEKIKSRTLGLETIIKGQEMMIEALLDYCNLLKL